MTTYDSTTERFLAKVEAVPFSGCWIWMSSISNGYGTFSLHGKHEKAHRASWRLFRGPISDGLLVCHICDVRCCVNPNHLFLGTTVDNTCDTIDKDKLGHLRMTFKDGKYFCYNGLHEMIRDNIAIYYHSNGRIRRYCKACRELKEHRKYSRRKDLRLDPCKG